MINWKNQIERHLHVENDQDSHMEQDCVTFHPSALSRCKRQCVKSKLGLDNHGTNTLFNFYLGTRMHDDLRAWFEGSLKGVDFEKDLSHEVDDGSDLLRFVGRCDVIDNYENVVYDFKTRKSWNGFDGASDAHKDQITAYMKMAGVDKAQLVYIIKSAPWDEEADIVKTWPEEGYFEFDEERWQKLEQKAREIRDSLREFGSDSDELPSVVDELPFEPCGCWICGSEDA